MQPFSPRLSCRIVLGQAVALLTVSCLLGACDRHRADELPESYGHGSSHGKSFDLHEPDSRNGSKHFSDSTGVRPEGTREEAKPEEKAKPEGTVSGQMFPTGK